MSVQQRDNSFGIAGRVALVSGGNRNIGRSIVLTLAREGVTTIILYRDGEDEAKQVCAEVTEIGARAGMYKTDLADTASLEPLVRNIEKDHGGTVNVVVPGTIDTQRPHPEWYPELKSGYAERLQRIPMARLGQPQEVANACLFLASELAGFTTAQELCASGGAVPLVRQTLDEYAAGEF